MARPTKYLQADARWSTQSYSAPGESTTIGKAGCGPTCAAMIIASIADKKVTPIDTCKWSLEHGYKAKNQGTYYTYFVPQLATFGISCRRINAVNIYGAKTQTAKAAHQLMERELQKGNWIIACCGPGIWTSSGHYVLAYKAAEGKVYINDPASEQAMRECNDLKLFQSQVKYYWIVEVPKKPALKEDDEVIEKRKITIFGRQYAVDGIFKDGKNYLSPKVLKDAGLDVTNDGSEPIVATGSIKVSVNGETRRISGFNSNGVNYAGVRQIAEMLGHTVRWENGTVIIE